MPVDTEYYASLQLKPGSSMEDVKSQYRRLAKAFHPDRNPGDAWYEDQFKRVNAAYDFLKDPGRKASYDLKFKRSPAKPAPKPQTDQGAPPGGRPSGASEEQKSKGQNAKSQPYGVKYDAKYDARYDVPLNPSPVQEIRLSRRLIARTIVVFALIIILSAVYNASSGYFRNPFAASEITGAYRSSFVPSNTVSTHDGAPGATPARFTIPASVPDSSASSGFQDPEKALASERAKETAQLANVKIPLIARLHAVSTRTNALIAQGNSLLKTNEDASGQFTRSGDWDRQNLTDQLATDLGSLRSSLSYVKSTIDDMAWYEGSERWSQESQQIISDLQEIENSQRSVLKEIQVLSSSTAVPSRSLPRINRSPFYKSPSSGTASYGSASAHGNHLRSESDGGAPPSMVLPR